MVIEMTEKSLQNILNKSHEIRTLMNVIIGMTSIAKTANSVERKDYALGKIEDASNRLLGVINNILELSEIDADKLDLRPVSSDFEDLRSANNTTPARAGQFYGYRALLVEDVEINREIIIALLEPTLLEIDCAENGAEAVKMYSGTPDMYNIILMDIQMPEMDGFEATRRIRALGAEKAGTIPIIAMTASAFKEDVENCLLAGMNDHLSKPVDYEVLIQLLSQYMLPQKPAIERRKSDRRQNKSDRRQGGDRRKGDRRRNAGNNNC